MKCSEMMKRDVYTAHPDTSLQAVAWAMLQRHVSFVPVVDGERRLRGAVTERGLLAHVVASGRASADLKAVDVANDLPIVGPDDEHGTAEQKMRESGSTRAAVVDAEGHFLGALSLANIADKAGSSEAATLLGTLRRTEM